MKRITLEQQAQVIDDWKRRSGITGRDYVPVNGGLRRSAAKRVLLREIARDAAARGITPVFPARF